MIHNLGKHLGALIIGYFGGTFILALVVGAITIIKRGAPETMGDMFEKFWLIWLFSTIGGFIFIPFYIALSLIVGVYMQRRLQRKHANPNRNASYLTFSILYSATYGFIATVYIVFDRLWN